MDKSVRPSVGEAPGIHRAASTPLGNSLGKGRLHPTSDKRSGHKHRTTEPPSPAPIRQKKKSQAIGALSDQPLTSPVRCLHNTKVGTVDCDANGSIQGANTKRRKLSRRPIRRGSCLCGDMAYRQNAFTNLLKLLRAYRDREVYRT